MLKPQDILVSLRLLLAERRGEVPSYPMLSQWTGLSASEAHSAVKRAAQSSLVTKTAGSVTAPFAWRANRAAIEEFLLHAIPFLLPLELGTLQRGMPTGAAALSPTSPSTDIVEAESWVWPFAQGSHRGIGVKPLYPSAPAIAATDRTFYEVLAATDLMRTTNTRLKRLGHTWLHANLLRL